MKSVRFPDGIVRRILTESYKSLAEGLKNGTSEKDIKMQQMLRELGLLQDAIKHFEAMSRNETTAQQGTTAERQGGYHEIS